MPVVVTGSGANTTGGGGSTLLPSLLRALEVVALREDDVNAYLSAAMPLPAVAVPAAAVPVSTPVPVPVASVAVPAAQRPLSSISTSVGGLRLHQPLQESGAKRKRGRPSKKELLQRQQVGWLAGWRSTR